MGVDHLEEVSHMDVQLYKNSLLTQLLEDKCSVALKIVMFWLSRALLHTVIYFLFAGSCFTSVSQ